MSMCLNKEHYYQQLSELLQQEKENLKVLVKLAVSFLEDSEDNYEEHAGNCSYYQAFHPDKQYCNCGASNWVIQRKKVIAGINEILLTET